MSGEFSQEWPEDDRELPYILEPAEVDLVKLYAIPRPARLELPPESD